MANTIRVYGASDDLVEFEGFISDEFSPPRNGLFEAKLIAPDGSGLTVCAAYVSPGTWMVGIAPLDEDHLIPDWGITLGASLDCAYSAGLTLTVPDGTTLIPKADD